MIAAQRSLGTKGAKSENLKDTELEDEQELTAGEANELDQFEAMLEEKRASTVWSEAGEKKDEVIRKLIKVFSSFVAKYDEDDDITGRTQRFYEKLPDAHIAVVKARVLLRDNENYDTRDFTLYVASKKWLNSELVPLMELSTEDRDLCLKCCKLVMVLIKGLRDPAKKALKMEVKFIKGKEEKEEAAERFQRETKTKANATKQLSALISFKEALCTEKCALAVTNVFAHALQKDRESQNQREDTKLDIAVCLSYLRRLLQIDFAPNCSQPGEMALAMKVHYRMVYHFRAMLFSIPMFCADINSRQHSDWLTDIIMIVHYALRGHDPKDLFKVWKERCIVDQDKLIAIAGKNESALLAAGDQIKRDLATAAENSEDRTKSTQKPMAATASSASAPGAPRMAVSIPNSLAQKAPSKASKGILSGILQKERGERQKMASTMVRHSRFVGSYKVQLGTTTTTVDVPATGNNADGEQGSPGKATVTKQLSMIVRRPFDNPTESLAPQAKKLRGKKNLTFVGENPYVDFIGMDLKEEESQKACVVAATMADRICVGMGLKQLILRVNEDLRRDDHIVSGDHELVYFQVLAGLLRYNRMKLEYEKTVFEQKLASRPEDAGETEGWVPELQNMINALDKMTFTRVLYSMEKLHTKDKRFADEIHPIELYKEMICYLRVLLESSDSDHNDIAVAALYRIFYASSERQDPLPRLLSQWKPGVYGKKHLNMLVTLVHETMKTLDTARSRFNSRAAQGADLRKKKGPKGKKELDIEQYTAACICFSVEEYFRRLVSNPTVRLYTRLLANYSKNEPCINHFAYCFLQRMSSFRIEQDIKAPAPPPEAPRNLLPTGAASATASASNAVPATQPATAAVEEPLTLCHYLFNVTTLNVFSEILNDTSVYKVKTMEPLIRLIKSVVRKFGEACRKNHLLFVEALFQHAHAQDFILKLDNVYEATTFISSRGGPMGASGPGGKGSYDSDEDSLDAEAREKRKEQKRQQSKDGSGNGSGGLNESISDSSSSEEEFDENDISETEIEAARAAMAKSKKPRARATKKAQAPRRRRIRDDSDSGSSSDTDLEDLIGGVSDGARKAARPKRTVRKTRESDSAEGLLGSDDDLFGASDDEAGAKRAKNDSDNDSDRDRNSEKGDGDDDNDDEDLFNASSKRKDRKNKDKHKQKSKKSRSSKEWEDDEDAAGKKSKGKGKGTRWSREEDDLLRKEYPQYAELNSCYEMLSSRINDKFDTERTVRQVAKRVRDLKLHLTTFERRPGGGGGGDEEEEEDAEEEEPGLSTIAEPIPDTLLKMLHNEDDLLMDFGSDDEQDGVGSPSRRPRKSPASAGRSAGTSSSSSSSARKRSSAAAGVTSPDDEAAEATGDLGKDIFGDSPAAPEGSSSSANSIDDRFRTAWGSDEENDDDDKGAQVKKRKLKRAVRASQADDDSDDEMFRTEGDENTNQNVASSSATANANATASASSSSSPSAVVKPMRNRMAIIDSDEE